MSLSLLNSTILRQKIASGFVTKGSSIAWLEEDDNWTIVVDAIRELANVPTDTTGFEEYNAGTTYSDGDFVAYNGNIYQYINNVPSAGVTPGTDPLYWELSSQGQFAHERNKDQYLDFGGTHQLSAEDIYDFINAVYPYLIQGTNTLTELTKILTDTYEFYIKSGANDAALPAAYILVDPDQSRLQYVVDADVVFEVTCNATTAGISHTNNSASSQDVSFGVVAGKAFCTKDIEITDINSGIILSDANGSGDRYRVTILDGSWNFELLP